MYIRASVDNFFCKLQVSAFGEAVFPFGLCHLFKVLGSHVHSAMNFSCSEGRVGLWELDRNSQNVLFHEHHGKGCVLALGSVITTYRANSSAYPPQHSAYSVSDPSYTLILTGLAQCSQLYLLSDESLIINHPIVSFFFPP